MQPRNLDFGFLDIGKDAGHPLVVGKSGLGRGYAPRRAIEQPGAEKLLQFHHRFADGRAGQP
jgi:hypothetical protein